MMILERTWKLQTTGWRFPMATVGLQLRTSIDKMGCQLPTMIYVKWLSLSHWCWHCVGWSCYGTYACKGIGLPQPCHCHKWLAHTSCVVFTPWKQRVTELDSIFRHWFLIILQTKTKTAIWGWHNILNKGSVFFKPGEKQQWGAHVHSSLLSVEVPWISLNNSSLLNCCVKKVKMIDSFISIGRHPLDVTRFGGWSLVLNTYFNRWRTRWHTHRKHLLGSVEGQYA